MTDYTPTTAEVRGFYLQAGEDWGDGLAKSAAEFDRWLDRYTAEKRAEWEAEQGEVEWGYLSGETNIAGDPHVQSVGADGEPFTREQASSRGRPAMRRTKGIPAGPWMPLEQGETTKTEGNEP